VLRAEEFYTGMLRDLGGKVRPGAQGKATVTVEGRRWEANWEVAHNAVWRHGRVFLRCPRCAEVYASLPANRRELVRMSTLLGPYLRIPLAEQLQESLWGRGEIARMFGTSHRDWAYEMTQNRREERRKASRQRQRERRLLLRRRGPVNV